MYDFKFDTFAWYINKNHPVIAAISMDRNNGGHVITCAGYRRSDNCLYFVDSADYVNKKYVNYDESNYKINMGLMYGKATIRFILIYP